MFIEKILKSIGIELPTDSILPTDSQLLKMSKNTIRVYARDHFGLHLDPRMTKKNMIATLKEKVNND